MLSIGLYSSPSRRGLTPVFKQTPKRLGHNQPVFRQQFTQDKLSVNGSGLVETVKIRTSGQVQHWYSVDDKNYAIADNDGDLTLLDSDGFLVALSDERDIYDLLLREYTTPKSVEIEDLTKYPGMTITHCSDENIYFMQDDQSYFCKCL